LLWICCCGIDGRRGVRLPHSYIRNPPARRTRFVGVVPGGNPHLRRLLLDRLRCERRASGAKPWKGAGHTNPKRKRGNNFHIAYASGCLRFCPVARSNRGAASRRSTTVEGEVVRVHGTRVRKAVRFGGGTSALQHPSKCSQSAVATRSE